MVNAISFPDALRKAEMEISTFDTSNISDYFGFSPRNLVYVNPKVHIYFEREDDPRYSPFHGTIFLGDEKKIIRGYPKIDYVNGHGNPSRTSTEIAERIVKNPPITFEEKINGINFRVFRHNGEYRFATRNTYDGTYGENWARYAKRISAPHHGLFQLVDEGYVPVVELTSPDFENVTGQNNEDGLFLIGLLKDQRFLSPQECTRLAREYSLRQPRTIRVENGDLTLEDLEEICRSLNKLCLREGIEGIVVKSSDGYNTHALKSKPKRERCGLKDAINNCLSRYYLEMGPESFLDGNLWGSLLSELSEYFILKETNLGVVKLRYDYFMDEARMHVRAKCKARDIIESADVKTRRDLAELISKRGIEGKVKHWLFRLYEERERVVYVPDTNFFHAYSVREAIRRGDSSGVRKEDRKYLKGLECIFPLLNGDVVVVPQVFREFRRSHGIKSPEEHYRDLAAKKRFDLDPSKEHVESVYQTIKQIRQRNAHSKSHLPKKPDSRKFRIQSLKDLNDARVVAEYEVLSRSDSGRRYVLISAEESVVSSVKERGGEAIQF